MELIIHKSANNGYIVQEPQASPLPSTYLDKDHVMKRVADFLEKPLFPVKTAQGMEGMKPLTPIIEMPPSDPDNS